MLSEFFRRIIPACAMPMAGVCIMTTVAANIINAVSPAFKLHSAPAASSPMMLRTDDDDDDEKNQKMWLAAAALRAV